MKLLCIGDSIVAGYPFGKDRSFPSVIEELTGINIINKGMPGATSKEIAPKLQIALDECEPDAVLILCGTNDALYAMSGARVILSNIKEMQYKAEEHGIKAILVIPALCYPHQAVKIWGALREVNTDFGMHCGVDPVEHQYESANDILRDLHEIMLEYCFESGSCVIDLQSKYKEYDCFHDGIHPTVEGYRFIGEYMAAELETILDLTLLGSV